MSPARPEGLPTGLWAAAEERPRLRVQQRSRARRPAGSSPAELTRRVAVLERAAIFYTLPASSLRALARRMHEVTVAPGSAVLYQGDASQSLFVIESGSCQVRVEKDAGHSVAVAMLTASDVFGEAACFSDEPSQASVVALKETVLLAVDRSSLHAVLRWEDEALVQLNRLSLQRRAAYSEIAAQGALRRPVFGASVVAFYSPKGGTGRTTLALNLAASLARRHPGEVLLLDLAFPFNHAALMANLVPTSCLARTSAAAPDSFEELLLSAILYHPSGLMVLPGALRPEEADLVTPEVVSAALKALRISFRYVLVDLGQAMTDSTLTVFDHAQHIVMVATPELSTLKSTADALEILGVLGFPAERLTVLLNHRSPQGGVSKAALERALGRQVAVEVAFDGHRPEQAALRGSILSVANGNSGVSRGARALADHLETQLRQEAGRSPAAAVSGAAEPLVAEAAE